MRGLRLAGFEFRWEVDARSAEPVATSDGVGSAGGPGGSGETPARRAPDVPEPASRRPSLEPPTGREAPAGSGAPVAITFDRLPDGRETCTPCAVGTEWSGQGLVVSFRSWSAGSTLPMVIDGRELLPAGRSVRVLGPAFLPDRGLEVGVIRLDFGGGPRSVSFSLFGPDLVRRFEVVAWSGASATGDPAVQRTVRGRYDAGGRGSFREERITVTAEGGIDRISLDGWGPPGHLLLVDDLRITP